MNDTTGHTMKLMYTEGGTRFIYGHGNNAKQITKLQIKTKSKAKRQTMQVITKAFNQDISFIICISILLFTFFLPFLPRGFYFHDSKKGL